jgi:hypothetical protein
MRMAYKHAGRDAGGKAAVRGRILDEAVAWCDARDTAQRGCRPIDKRWKGGDGLDLASYRASCQTRRSGSSRAGRLRPALRQNVVDPKRSFRWPLSHWGSVRGADDLPEFFWSDGDS